MKFGFQINLDVKDRPCLVVGGGDEATEKTQKLLDAGAKVTVISPTLSDELKTLAASAKILHRGRHFKASDVDGGVWLVMNTVKDDQVLVRDLYSLARQKGFLVWSDDQPEYSTFTMPALVTRGPLRIAISTSGVSPALAKRVKEDLEPLFDERFEVFLEWLDAYRVHLQATEPHVEKRAQLLRDAVAKVKLHAKIEFPKVEKKAT
ncbi:MAG: bifunctional precorrin-2 dehydrogenase/sirohydrochlorin ferrochelatase [Nitrospirae bacterium]|nr:MAG: bifunctional precorrin-2 dehydrogenase/sirohydrochlorin ferrochelatase [Nitrospirota bacterium]